MFSRQASRPAPAARVAAKGERLQTRRSIGAIPCAASAALCSARSRCASRPAWIAGCSVLTRPSSSSGKPVTAATSVTGRPAAASARAVPPVESSTTPRAARAAANGTSPLLSLTESSARRIWRMAAFIAAASSNQRPRTSPSSRIATIGMGKAALHRALIEVPAVCQPDPLAAQQPPEQRQSRVGEEIKRQDQRDLPAAAQREIEQQKADQIAERRAADIAEKDAGRRPVPDEKSGRRPDDGGGEGSHPGIDPGAEAGEQHEAAADRHRLAASEPVDAVHEVEGVDEPQP